MATSLHDFLEDELSSERVAEVVATKGLDPTLLVERHLFDGRTHLRRNAALALSKMGPLEVDNLHWVLVATKDSDPQVRAYATSALPVCGLEAEDAFKGLLHVLGDAEASVVEAAQSAIEELVARHQEALTPLLIGHLNDHRPRVSAACDAQLLRIGGDTATRLVEACCGKDSQLALAAAKTLGRLGIAAQGALIAGLKSRIGRFRLVGLLDELPAPTGEDRKRLEAYAQAEDEERDLALVAQRLLSRPPPSAPPGPPSYPDDAFTEAIQAPKALKAYAKATPDRASLIQGLEDPRSALRVNCAALLGMMAEDEDTLRALSTLTRDEDPDMRAAVATALAALGGVEALVVCLEDREDRVRGAAMAGVALVPPTKIAPLVEALSGASDALQSDLSVALVARAKAAVAGLSQVLIEGARVPSRVFAARLLAAMAADHAPAAEALVKALSDESEAVQSQAASGLVALGSDATPETRGAVRDRFTATTSDAVLRACSRAMDAFEGRTPPPLTLAPAPLPMAGFDTTRLEPEALEKGLKGSTVSALEELLHDGRPMVRLNAVASLSLSGQDAAEAIGGIAMCLKDSEEEVRMAAVEALGRLALKPDHGVPALLHARVGARADMRQAIDEAMRAYGARAVDPLISLIGGSASLGADVLEALACLGEAAAKALVALLKDDALTMRLAAARGLGAFGSRASKATRQAVSRAFHDADEPEMLRACSAALDAIDGEVPPPVVTEAQALPTEDFDQVALTDSALKKDAPSMDLGRLGELLFDGRVLCRLNAAQALGHAAKGAEAFVGALVVVLRDSDPRVRQAAAKALGRLKSDSQVVVPGLARAAGSDRSDEVKQAAFEALDAFGKDALAPSIALLESPPERAAVVAQIAARAPKTFLKPLVEVLQTHPSPRAQENAALALGRLGEDAQSAEKALVEVMKTSDVPLKCIVARALGEVAKPSQALVDTLHACALDDERESVAEAVRQALRGLKRRA